MEVCMVVVVEDETMEAVEIMVVAATMEAMEAVMDVILMRAAGSEGGWEVEMIIREGECENLAVQLDITYI